jgi:hypothetical protein
MNLIRGILGWPSAAGHLLGGFANRAGPAIFGADPGIPMEPQDRNAALRNAMMTAGTAMAGAAGGPRRWGEFAPSPIASIMAGLQAGREGYQATQEEARGQSERRAIGARLLANPTRTGLMSAWAQLMERNPVAAQQAATQAAALGSSESPMTPLEIEKLQAEIAATRALAEERRRIPVVPPRNLDPNSPEVRAQRNADERELIAYRAAVEARGPGGVNRETTRLNAAIDDVRGAIATAESGLSAQAKRTGQPRTPSDSTAVQEVARLRARLPALTARRDSLIGEAPVAAVSKTPAQWVAEVRGDPAFRGRTPAEIAAEARRRAGQ